jgi:hypothetical protein
MTNVVNLQAQTRLIREAQESREKRAAERKAERKIADNRLPPVRYPGGIDDIPV